jgi:hypothetical protein
VPDKLDIHGSGKTENDNEGRKNCRLSQSASRPGNHPSHTGPGVPVPFRTEKIGKAVFLLFEFTDILLDVS